MKNDLSPSLPPPMFPILTLLLWVHRREVFVDVYGPGQGLTGAWLEEIEVGGTRYGHSGQEVRVWRAVHIVYKLLQLRYRDAHVQECQP